MIGDLCVFHFNSIAHWWEPFEASPDSDCICIQLINFHPWSKRENIMCRSYILFFPKREIVINSIKRSSRLLEKASILTSRLSPVYLVMLFWTRSVSFWFSSDALIH